MLGFRPLYPERDHLALTPPGYLRSGIDLAGQNTPDDATADPHHFPCSIPSPQPTPNPVTSPATMPSPPSQRLAERSTCSQGASGSMKRLRKRAPKIWSASPSTAHCLMSATLDSSPAS